VLTDIATTQSVSLRMPNESWQALAALRKAFLPAADLLPVVA
jgi:hypothetical protein